MPGIRRTPTGDQPDSRLAPSTARIFMAAAYITTAAVYAVTLLNSDLRQPSIWIPLTVLFAFFTLIIYLEPPISAPLWRRAGHLVLQVALIFAIVLVGRGFEYLPILYFIVIPMAYFSLSFWQATGIALFSITSLLLAFVLAHNIGLGMAAILLLPYGGGMLFFSVLSAAFTGQIEERQRAERLLAELENAHQQLRAYAAQVEALAVLEERNRLAREIHDSLGHYLTAITMQLEAAGKLIAGQPERAAESIAKAQEMAREGLAEVRRSVAALRTSPLDTVSLGDAIGQVVEHLRSSGIATTFTTEGEPYPVPMQATTTLYRAAQEGLTNVQKHARASAVAVTLAYQPEQVTLTIVDNGIGKRDEGSAGFGLLGLRERITLLGGSLEAGDSPQGGFRLCVSIPRTPQGQDDERDSRTAG